MVSTPWTSEESRKYLNYVNGMLRDYRDSPDRPEPWKQETAAVAQHLQMTLDALENQSGRTLPMRRSHKIVCGLTAALSVANLVVVALAIAGSRKEQK